MSSSSASNLSDKSPVKPTKLSKKQQKINLRALDKNSDLKLTSADKNITAIISEVSDKSANHL
jgi:hypothetical protein